MADTNDDPQERARVFANIAPLILAYASDNAGRAFHAEELRQFVLRHDPSIAPASPDRILRELRLVGKLDYVVLNRRQSLYQFREPVVRGSDMPMNREDFLAKLEIVAPALSTTAMIPIMSHIWFTGTHVTAYNDQLAIQTTLQTGFHGALPGKVLMELLKASSARDITLDTVGEAGVEIRAAGARFKLAYHLPDSFERIFAMPESPVHPLAEADRQAFFRGLEYCMLSVTRDPARPEHMGVTVVPEADACLLYATSGLTMSRTPLAPTPAVGQRAILPTPFIEALLKHRDAATLALGVHADHVRAVVGDTTLFGRLIDCPNPLDFESTFAEHWPPADDFSPIPQFLWKAVERATIITNARVEQPKSAVRVRDGKLQLLSQSVRGEVQDELRLDHADVDVHVDSRLIHAGSGMFDHLYITDACVMFANGDHAYLIAASR